MSLVSVDVVVFSLNSPVHSLNTVVVVVIVLVPSPLSTVLVETFVCIQSSSPLNSSVSVTVVPVLSGIAPIVPIP